MKIGILTFHWAQNYGAVLQCYALKSKLQEMGHDVCIIDRVPQYRGFLRNLYHRISYKYFWSWLKFSDFNRKYLVPKTRQYNSMDALMKQFTQEKLDAVVVGSDQVWRWGMMGYNYFLDFVDKYYTRKYAYAASFGLSYWTDNGLSTAHVTRLMKEFKAITVREHTGITLCERIFGVQARLAVDPTLLYDASFYERTLLEGMPKVSQHKVVSCILGDENLDQCKHISNWAEKEGMAYEELFWTDWGFPALRKGKARWLHLSVQEWLNAIRGAEYVITNSFHCTVFAILFRKRFLVLDNHSGGIDRIRTLLSTLGLKHHSLATLGDEEELHRRLDTPISYDDVDARLNALRKESLAFLQEIA